jgi:hypothetical protein
MGKPPRFLTVSMVARQLDVIPRVISDLFYRRKLDDSTCPIVNGARIIPHTYIPKIVSALLAAGVKIKKPLIEEAVR